MYNSEQYLSRCIDSVLNQTLKSVEVILVDDGSSDASPLICDEYAKNNENVIVIHKQNSGQGLARNDGMKNVNGRYVAFLDSDDYMNADAYENIVNRLDVTNADVCAFGYDKLDANGICRYKVKIREREYSGRIELKEFMLHFFGDNPKDDDLRGVSACMSVYRAQIMKDNNVLFPSERAVLSEDTIFNLEYCKHINKAVTMEDSYYHYCIHEQSHTQRFDAGRIARTDEFCSILFKYAEYYGITVETEDRINMVMWLSIMESIKRAVLQKNIVGREGAYKLVKRIVNNDIVREYISNLKTSGLSIKQKSFYFAIKHRFIALIYNMADIKNRCKS